MGPFADVNAKVGAARDGQQRFVFEPLTVDHMVCGVRERHEEDRAGVCIRTVADVAAPFFRHLEHDTTEVYGPKGPRAGLHAIAGHPQAGPIDGIPPGIKIVEPSYHQGRICRRQRLEQAGITTPQLTAGWKMSLRPQRQPALMLEKNDGDLPLNLDSLIDQPTLCLKSHMSWVSHGAVVRVPRQSRLLPPAHDVLSTSSREYTHAKEDSCSNDSVDQRAAVGR